MRITVTETRECCQHRDLKPVGGRLGPKHGLGDYDFMFCTHCGRHHRGQSERDAAGGTDWVYKPMPWPWEPAFPGVLPRCPVHGADGQCEKQEGHVGPHQAVGGCFSTTVGELPLCRCPVFNPTVHGSSYCTCGGYRPLRAGIAVVSADRPADT